MRDAKKIDLERASSKGFSSPLAIKPVSTDACMRRPCGMSVSPGSVPSIQQKGKEMTVTNF
jgi:hypothetical protein